MAVSKSSTVVTNTKTSGGNKSSSVDNAINQIQRQFGKGSIMRLDRSVFNVRSSFLE